MTTTTETPRFDPEQLETTQNDRNALRGSWSFGLDLIQQTLTAYTDHERDVLISAFRWCVDPEHPTHLKDFAATVKSNDNTLYKIYTGRYRYQPEIIERKDGAETRRPHPKAGQLCPLPSGLISEIEKFIALEKKRFARGKTALSETPTVLGIGAYCNQIRESQHIGFVVGPSHVGKTVALKEYADSNNHGRTIFVPLPAAAGLHEVLVVICEAMSISPEGNVEKLKRKIKNGLTKNMLLILDEVHLLDHTTNPKAYQKIIEVIRRLHDAKKVGVVLCFTELDGVLAAKSKGLSQLWRRAPRKYFLPPMPAMEDLTVILEDNGLGFPEKDSAATLTFEVEKDGKIVKETIVEKPREVLRQLAKDEGLLAITERISAAKALAKERRQSVAWKHFIEVHLEIAAQAADKKDEVWE